MATFDMSGQKVTTQVNVGKLPGPICTGPRYQEMPNPTEEQLNDPMFNAIWDVIKTWDVNAPEYYFGYCGANGSHVMLIWNAIQAVKGEVR